MTKLELVVSAETLNCVSCSPETAAILGIPTNHDSSPPPFSNLLANLREFESFQAAISSNKLFTTLNLVFSAPNAAGSVDRSALSGVFCSPMRAIHCCTELQLACFTHIERKQDLLYITALEYDRTHRQEVLRREFGSWLLEEHIEKSVIATNLKGDIVFWNRYATKLYQYEAEEALGRNIVELTPSEVTLEQATEIMRKLSAGEHWSGMFGVQRKDGSKFMAHVSDTPILDAGGAVKFIVGVSDNFQKLYDVMHELETLNANLELEVQSRTKELTVQETNLRMVGAAVRESDTGVAITDNDGRILWTNEAVCKILSIPEEKLIGCQPWKLDIFNKDEFPTGQQLALFLEKALDTEGEEQIASDLIDVGDFLPVDCITVTVQRRSDQHMITVRDMTAQRHAEIAQRKAEAAAAASDSKTQTMQMLSHELRTPLQGIMGVASTLLLDLKPEDTNFSDGLSTILASSRLLLTLIGNVLDLRKVELNMMKEMELKPTDIRHSVEESIRYCEPFANVNEVTVVSTGLEQNFLVMGNKLRLEQILVNLLTNSIKYTYPDTDVEVSLRRCSGSVVAEETRLAEGSDLEYHSTTINGEADYVIVSVRDHGPGIPSDEKHKVFAAYQQLSASENMDQMYSGSNKGFVGQSTGSGLGLNLVMKFLERMNGHIWYQNCPSEGGVCFSFCLPLAIDQTSTLTPKAAALHTRTEDKIRLAEGKACRLRVLVVDDSVINVKVLTRMLYRLGVEHVDTSYSGRQALDLLRNTSDDMLPNLIISDLQMPGMSGEELVVRIRALNLPSNPIMTAYTADWTTAAEESVLRAGFDGVLKKPITIEDLEDFLIGLETAQ